MDAGQQEQEEDATDANAALPTREEVKQLSKQMLQGTVQAGSHIVLDVFDGVVVFRQAIKAEEMIDAELS